MSVEEVRTVVINLHDEGNRHIKSHDVADRIDGMTVRGAAQYLSRLEDEGIVEKWGRTTSATWRITL